jgi:hypothetical protein
MKAQPEVAAFDVNPPAITNADIKFFTAIHRFALAENHPRSHTKDYEDEINPFLAGLSRP